MIKKHSCIKILKAHKHTQLWYVLFFIIYVFESQITLRAPVENNVPGGAKGKICPLIHRK